MKVFTSLVDVLGYLTEGALELFSPNHDSYPLVGVQPYSGEAYHPSKKSKKSHYLEPVAKVSNS